jgi:hypothetical protein
MLVVSKNLKVLAVITGNDDVVDLFSVSLSTCGSYTWVGIRTLRTMRQS